MAHDVEGSPSGETPLTDTTGLRHHAILVVEDDPDLQWKIARMLTLRGNRVVGTSSGEAALELMAQWPVDLVLVDELLPAMSGLELARIVRERYAHLPVVLMAENGERGIQHAAFSAIVHKPFRIEAVLDVLRTLLGRLTFPPPA
jgi:CheY-like chemotaxis protein